MEGNNGSEQQFVTMRTSNNYVHHNLERSQKTASIQPTFHFFLIWPPPIFKGAANVDQRQINNIGEENVEKVRNEVILNNVSGKIDHVNNVIDRVDSVSDNIGSVDSVSDKIDHVYNVIDRNDSVSNNIGSVDSVSGKIDHVDNVIDRNDSVSDKIDHVYNVIDRVDNISNNIGSVDSVSGKIDHGDNVIDRNDSVSEDNGDQMFGILSVYADSELHSYMDKTKFANRVQDFGYIYFSIENL